jgi:predicted nucleotidyltransferase
MTTVGGRERRCSFERTNIAGEVTKEAAYLRTLADRVVQAALDSVPLRAALLAGSAGRGNADRFSDIDLLFYVDVVPSLNALSQIRRAVGGVNPLRRYEPTEYATGEEFTLSGVRTEVSFTTVARVESQISLLLDELDDVVSSRQKFLSGVAEGLPLYGDELIRSWKTRLVNYPESLRKEMIERNWDFFPLWYYDEAIAARDSELWRLDMLLSGAFNLLGVLAGLNRVYFARFELKRMRDLVAKMPLAPPSLADRMESLFRLPPPEAAKVFGALVEETRALVATEFPDLNLPIPFPPDTRQRPWPIREVDSRSR